MFYLRSIGTTPSHKRWLNLDCCGLACAGFTMFLHIWADFTLVYRVLRPWLLMGESVSDNGKETKEDGGREGKERKSLSNDWYSSL